MCSNLHNVTPALVISIQNLWTHGLPGAQRRGIVICEHFHFLPGGNLL